MQVKNRDLWDIAWLKQQGIELPLALVPAKISDHRHTVAAFRSQLKARLSALKADPAVRRDFVKEMQRFLPAATVRETVEQESYWEYLAELVRAESAKAMTVG